jgi:hypothetical protein
VSTSDETVNVGLVAAFAAKGKLDPEFGLHVRVTSLAAISSPALSTIVVVDVVE